MRATSKKLQRQLQKITSWVFGRNSRGNHIQSFWREYHRALSENHMEQHLVITNDLKSFWFSYLFFWILSCSSWCTWQPFLFASYADAWTQITSYWCISSTAIPEWLRYPHPPIDSLPRHTWSYYQLPSIMLRLILQLPLHELPGILNLQLR